MGCERCPGRTVRDHGPIRNAVVEGAGHEDRAEMGRSLIAYLLVAAQRTAGRADGTLATKRPSNSLSAGILLVSGARFSPRSDAPGIRNWSAGGGLAS